MDEKTIQEQEVIVKETPKKRRSTVKAPTPLNYNKLYIKGLEFNEIIELDISDNHSHKVDAEIYRSKLLIRDEEITIRIKWNVSRSNYQGLVSTAQITQSLSFFPHFDHCRAAIKQYIGRMI